MSTKNIQLPDPLPKFLTVQEVAVLLRLAPRTVYNMVHQRRIPFRKAGKLLLFESREIEDWTKGGAAAEDPSEGLFSVGDFAARRI
jgi:excisionase family DNA binding protein